MKLDIIKTEDIYRKSFKYISNKSKSNTLPYHNMDHLVMVFNNSYSASEYYKLDEILGESTTKELCVASLFHDSNHSGGELSDPENVSNSIKLFDEFWEEYNNGELSNDDLEFQKNVHNIILATEYPHRDMDLNIQQKIIRDADMMSFNQNNHLYSVIFGLSEEFKSESLIDQIQNQTIFTLKLKDNLYTDWAKSKFENKFGNLLSDLSIMSDIFKSD